MTARLAAVRRRVARHSGVRFLVIGAGSVVIDAGTLFVLHGLLGVWLPLATAVAFLVSVAFNFVLNRRWTFGASGAVHRHATRYAVLVAVNTGLTVALVQALTWLGLPYLAAKLCTTAVLSVSNYLVSRAWVFD